MSKLNLSSSVLPTSCIEPSSPTIAVSTESKNVDGGEFEGSGAGKGLLLERGSSADGLGGSGGGRGRPVLCVG